MKLVKADSKFFTGKRGFIMLGAIVGAVAGSAAVIGYSLWVGKGSMAAAVAGKVGAITGKGSTIGQASLVTDKMVLGLQQVSQAPNIAANSHLLNTLLPLSAGAVAGGSSGLLLNKQQSGKNEAQKKQQNGIISELQEKINVVEEGLLQLTSKIDPIEKLVDELQQVKGIGPKFSALLQKHDINDLNDLVQISLDDLHKIMKSHTNGQLSDIESWKDQAYELLAKHKQEKNNSEES
jgi:predicted flap endonuclease-1-like 5' DNA nuclease